MAWSNNNLAHRRVWWALFLLEQSQRTFSNSGDVKMNQLAFWVPGESAAIRKGKARGQARVLNNMFSDLFFAEFEPNVTKTKAVNAMVQVLIQGSATMEKLADEVDAMYLFEGEDQIS